MSRRLKVACEHDKFVGHCSEHLGSGPHFGVATHEGGCPGPQPAELSDVVAWLEEHHGAEMKWQCAAAFSFAKCEGPNYLTRLAEQADHSRCGKVLVVRVSDD